MAAEEFGNEGAAGRAEDIARGAGLLDHGVVHDDDLIRERHGLCLGMGHVDEGDPKLAFAAV